MIYTRLTEYGRKRHRPYDRLLTTALTAALLGCLTAARAQDTRVRMPPRPAENLSPSPSTETTTPSKPAPPDAATRKATGPAPAAPQAGSTMPLDTRADRLDYDRTTGWIEARGNVLIRKGGEELAADYVRVNVNTEEALAFGNVVLRRGEEVWRGNRLRYNFRTHMGDVAGLTGDSGPFKIHAEETHRMPDSSFVFHDATITTCTNAPGHRHYYVTAKRVSVVPNERLKAYGAVWHFGRVPVMYLPYWYRSLNEDMGFRLRVGHDSRLGVFVLSSYRYRMTSVMRGETHVDYYSDRGVGFGQDLRWQDPEAGAWNGALQGYFIDDDKPVDEDEDIATADIENQRYRIKLEHEANFSYRDYLLARAQYLSDTDILEDFFENEYREESVPDNYTIYTHRGDIYTLNFLTRGVLNDFYGGVNRVPEMSVEFLPSSIAGSSFYYEGQTAVAYLERVFPKNNTTDTDYSAFRIDTEHLLSYVSKHFGFLNVIPRVGWRGTYYSKTRETSTRTLTTTTTETNYVVDAMGVTNPVVTTVTEAEEVTEEIEGPADMRSLFEIGLETSFKGFKTWESIVGERRHVVEPYADYTYVREPKLLASQLYQFDDVDTLGEEHYVRFGVRNKLQRKEKGLPFDMVDVDVYTRYRIKRDEGQSTLGHVFMDAEFRPADGVAIDMDAKYNTDDSTLENFNTWVRLWREKLWLADIEHRFRHDRNNLLIANVTFFPDCPWTLNTFGRYEFENSRLEEQGGYIQRNLDCLSIRAGMTVFPGYTRSDGTERKDEVRFMCELWLTAFPESGLGGTHRQ